MADYQDLDGKVTQLSKQIVRMCTEAGSGHPSSALSLVHIVTALMYRTMRYEPANPWNAGADRLVLSEGHAVPVIYAAYCDLGGVVGQPNQPSELRFEDALTLRAADSVLDGHPNPAIAPFDKFVRFHPAPQAYIRQIVAKCIQPRIKRIQIRQS